MIMMVWINRGLYQYVNAFDVLLEAFIGGGGSPKDGGNGDIYAIDHRHTYNTNRHCIT